MRSSSERARDLTIKGNSVAIVSDGSAVLDLGNIGPLAATPVMEGKALLESRCQVRRPVKPLHLLHPGTSASQAPTGS